LLTFDSCALSGNADVCARKSTADNINDSAPGLAVECAHVVPHREPWHDSVALALQQQFPVFSDNLDGAYGSVSE
jgi:hypothetical protein